MQLTRFDRSLKTDFHAANPSCAGDGQAVLFSVTLHHLRSGSVDAGAEQG
jgi:hypothetical protein